MNKNSKNIKNNINKSQSNFFSTLIRHLDIYGQPLQWYISSDKKYNTVAGGTRSFLVVGCSLIFLVYSIIKLLSYREGNFVFYDIVQTESEDVPFFYYKDFEIFFYFQKSNRRFMVMNSEILQATLGETYTVSNCPQDSEESKRRNLNEKKYKKKGC